MDGESNCRRQSRTRFIALDALRGLAIVLMLLVNNFGVADETPKPLRHAGWEGGVHLADLAFPWFLFCVGVALPFSFASFKRSNQPAWKYDLKVLKRTLILIAIGAVLDSSSDHQIELFSIGVLQTIAIAYMISAFLYELPAHRRLGMAGIFLVIYWAAIKFVPVPGVGAGAFSENQNFIIHLNRTYLGQVGLWNLPRLIPTTALVLIGTAIGDLVRKKEVESLRKAGYLTVIGMVLMVGGYLWNINLPYNKPIWTPSYILLSAGTGAFLLGIFSMIIDTGGWQSWTYPLVVFGSNAILIYVLPIIVKALVLSPLGIYVGGWLRVVPFVLFWWLVSWALYREKIFVKL